MMALAFGVGVTITGVHAQGTANPALNGTPSPAQNGASSKVYQAIGAADMASILTDMAITSEIIPSEGGEPPGMVAQTAGGGRFLVGFLKCSDIAAAEDCASMVVFTAMPSAGITFDDLNQFNLASEAARAVYDSDNQLVIFGTHIIVAGGAGRDNLTLNLLLYFDDLNDYFKNRSSSNVSVSFDQPLNDVTPLNSSDTKVISPVSQVLLQSLKRHQISAAIHNNWTSRFPESSGKIDNN